MQWEFASVYANALNKHLIIHSREKLNKCNECDNASSFVRNYGNIFKYAQWGKVKHVYPT